MNSQKKTVCSQRYESTQRSSTSSVITTKRGFKPSDRFDPSKKTFLVDLSKQIWKKRVSNTIYSGPSAQVLTQNTFLIAGPEERG